MPLWEVKIVAAQSHQPPPAEEQIIEEGGFELELFWHRHGRLVIILGLIVLALGLGTGAWFFNQHRQNVDSAALLAVAGNPGKWRDVIATYPHSAAAADAYFLIANSQQEQGDFAASSQTYGEFIAAFPDHQLVGGALLGIAENFLAQGKTAEALEKLRELQASHSSSYAAPFAALDEGRILMRQGKFADARRIFTNVLQVYPASPVVPFSASLLQEIDRIVPPDAPAKPAAQ